MHPGYQLVRQARLAAREALQAALLALHRLRVEQAVLKLAPLVVGGDKTVQVKMLASTVTQWLHDIPSASQLEMKLFCDQESDASDYESLTEKMRIEIAALSNGFNLSIGVEPFEFESSALSAFSAFVAARTAPSFDIEAVRKFVDIVQGEIVEQGTIKLKDGFPNDVGSFCTRLRLSVDAEECTFNGDIDWQSSERKAKLFLHRCAPLVGAHEPDVNGEPVTALCFSLLLARLQSSCQSLPPSEAHVDHLFANIADMRVRLDSAVAATTTYIKELKMQPACEASRARALEYTMQLTETLAEGKADLVAVCTSTADVMCSIAVSQSDCDAVRNFLRDDPLTSEHSTAVWKWVQGPAGMAFLTASDLASEATEECLKTLNVLSAADCVYNHEAAAAEANQEKVAARYIICTLAQLLHRDLQENETRPQLVLSGLEICSDTATRPMTQLMENNL